MAVLEDLTEDEAYLWAILSDPSGLDQSEFLWTDDSNEDGCFRAWPFQWGWYRDMSPQQIDQAGRSVGKSLSIKVRAFAFPFLHPGQEMVITAPEGNHLDAITDVVETAYMSCRLGAEMLVRGRNGIKHRPFHMNFHNGARIMGRIPQRDGKGVKGCLRYNEMILTDTGYVRVQDVKVGDRVLTHEGRYMPVQHIDTDVNDCYEVRGLGMFPLTVSCDHRFLGAANEAHPSQKRQFGDLYFEDVESLVEHRFFVASPRTFPELPIPEAEGLHLEEFWWLVGRYLADGWSDDRRVIWTAHPKDHSEIFARLQELDWHHYETIRDHSSAVNITYRSTYLSKWLIENFGKLAQGKRLPAWALGMKESWRQNLLDGYLSGDGSWTEERNRWTIGTASEELALGLQMLAQSLGYNVSSCHKVDIKVDEINGVKLKKKPFDSWRFHIKTSGHRVGRDGFYLGKVKSITPVGKHRVYNLITEDHSYLSGSIMSHNIHPVWLELDEAQDYPDAGWIELFETVKRGYTGSMWRAHGVTRGLRDYFYKFTQPDSGWQVHRITAMHRPYPFWSPEIRQEQIDKYGSVDHPDYRRNVLGLHGDATNPLFVLHRLMACVDTDVGNDYNNSEYLLTKINNEMVLDHGDDILPLLNFPESHRSYKNVWIGMDVGYTNSPSAIMVFGEDPRKTKNEPAKLRLLNRIMLERISNPAQVQAIMWLVAFYRPRAFAMDKTGVGLPLFQDIQEAVKQSPSMRPVLDTIKGYNFSSKILVDFDESIEVDEFRGDPEKEAGVHRQVLEYSSDKLRQIVDEKRMILPFDKELISEFQGQTWTYDKSKMDMYGRVKNFSKGEFHCLDATRMAVLGFVQYGIEELTKKDKYVPVQDLFLTF